jgi:hypothetical protein
MPKHTGKVALLPPLYDAWVTQFLSEAIPRETEATCDDCAMVCADLRHKRPAPGAAFFDARTKCCTYLPVLPNFLVGRMLADDSPEFARGRETLESRLATGVALTPFGLERTPEFNLLYGASAKSLFGRSHSLRCPHYLEDDGGRCGIWKHRAAICATWFCKYVRGAVGLRFWTTLHRLLSAVELDLSLWCALELGADSEAARDRLVKPDAPPPIDPAEVDRVPDVERQRRIWGKWFGRERQFFVACGKLVEVLKWRDVERICGPAVKALTRLTREAFDALKAHEIPASLCAGPYKTIAVHEDSSVVEGYSSGDAIELPNVVLAALHHFDSAHSTSQALRAIRQQTGVVIERDLLRMLIDFELLIERGQPSAASAKATSQR